MTRKVPRNSPSDRIVGDVGFLATTVQHLRNLQLSPLNSFAKVVVSLQCGRTKPKEHANKACYLPLIHLGLISVLLITLSLRRFLLKFAISLSLLFKLELPEERRKTLACEIFCE